MRTSGLGLASLRTLAFLVAAVVGVAGCGGGVAMMMGDGGGSVTVGDGACGGAGQACCAGACSDGLTCESDTCGAPPDLSVVASGGGCGSVGNVCCGTAKCDAGLTCTGGLCVQPARVGDVGKPCAVAADCASGQCIPVGQPAAGTPGGSPGWTGSVCTATCNSVGDCAGGWQCQPHAGGGKACTCKYAVEQCDGADDDCDGIVDNEPVSDADCASQRGASTYVCAGGACVCFGKLCGATCVDLSAPDNCGACGHACSTGGSCDNGVCGCPSGGVVCGDRCAVLDSDVKSCGACGHACATGGTCVAGKCGCPTGTTPCGNTCADLQTDLGNCGSCSNACATGGTCTAGACSCGTGQVVCSGKCADMMNTVTNCGGCGVMCTAAGQVCQSGACVCPTGATLCGDLCAATDTDPGNCGACGVVCTQPPTCAYGACCFTVGESCTNNPTACCRFLSCDGVSGACCNVASINHTYPSMGQCMQSCNCPMSGCVASSGAFACRRM